MKNLVRLREILVCENRGVILHLCLCVFVDLNKDITLGNLS